MIMIEKLCPMDKVQQTAGKYSDLHALPPSLRGKYGLPAIGIHDSVEEA
jgi:hypothetical protein